MAAADALVEVSSAEEFWAAPAGRVLRRGHFAYLGASPTFLSLLIWGHVGASDVDELIAVLAAAATRPVRRDALVQTQDLTGVDEVGLRAWARYMAGSVERSAAVTRREAVVRPSGTVGMLVAGFYGVISVRYPTAIFAERAAALAWLRVPARARARVSATSERLVHEACTTPDLLYRVRELLAGSGGAIDLGAVARALASSPRTVQRRLGESGTSFERELARARVAAAKTLLLRTTLAVKSIAHEVGLPSASRLSQLFAAHEGQSPSAWRLAHALP
jgi:AraC-like DNA-binding protein